MTKQNSHYIIRNEQGLECQRFYLDDSDLTFDEDEEVEYSFYHMAKYSFDDADLVFFLAHFHFFFVLPKAKDDSFMAFIPSNEQYVQNTAHIMKNSSMVWLLGGLKIKYELVNYEE